MENISKANPVSKRDLYYYRRRFQNRVFSKIAAFFAEEAERQGVSKRDIASRLERDPAQITRWLNHPSNMTLETISDLLLALNAEADPPEIVRFGERAEQNYIHPLIEQVSRKYPDAKLLEAVTASADEEYASVWLNNSDKPIFNATSASG